MSFANDEIDLQSYVLVAVDLMIRSRRPQPDVQPPNFCAQQNKSSEEPAMLDFSVSVLVPRIVSLSTNSDRRRGRQRKRSRLMKYVHMKMSPIGYRPRRTLITSRTA